MDTEIALNRMESLLESIAKLYSGVFASVMHERVNTYHAEQQAGDINDIGDALRTYIKRLQQQTSRAQVETSEPMLPQAPSHDHPVASVDGHVSGPHENALSDYFKKHNAPAEFASPLSEKLKSSAWAHTHSAIRFAHEGDYASAKLYADLANNAIHELGHYLSATDFMAFKRAVKSELLSK